jgi:hypothetical protein
MIRIESGRRRKVEPRLFVGMRDLINGTLAPERHETVRVNAAFRRCKVLWDTIVWHALIHQHNAQGHTVI